MKQRIIGAVVLGALIIIFFPILFKSPAPTAANSKELLLTEPATPAKSAPSALVTATKNLELNRKGSAAKNDSPIDDTKPAANVFGSNSLSSSASPSTEQASPSATQAELDMSRKNLERISSVQQTITPSVGQETNQTAEKIIKSDTTQQASAQAATQSLTQVAQNTIQQPTAIADSDTDVMPASGVTTTAVADVANSQKQAKVKVEDKMRLVESEALIRKPPAPKLKQVTEKKSKSKPKAVQVAATEAKTAKSTSAAIAGKAWLVQLGSFSNAANAESLQKKLRGQGYNAYLQKSKVSKNGQMMKVLVGPETQRAKAELVLNKINKELRLKGFIVPFEPSQKA